MQINHNIRAMVTQHALFQNNNAMTKSLEKLSTGIKINRAQDDAAGLAMSEQMRSQIRGFGKAKQNAQDGQAALQIAEGALGEITNMMQRQKELAVQAANDTLTSTERMYLNDEFQALTKEIDRIAKTTDYNGKNVLLFDVDENKSFAATKVSPYDKDISILEASNVIYKTFGASLTGSLGTISGSITVSGSATTLTGLSAINAAIVSINGVISTAQVLHADNIKQVLTDIVSYAGTIVTGSGNNAITLGGDQIWTGAANANAQYQALSAEDRSTLEQVNAFINAAKDALLNLNAASVGEANARVGASNAWAALQSYNGASDIKAAVFGNTTNTGISIIDKFVDSLGSATITMAASIFGSTNGQKAYQTLMQIDASKMESGTTANGTLGEQIKALQKYVSDAYDIVKTYNEGGTAVGTAASDLIHVTPNYSKGLGGADASEIKVNYTAIDVRGLGLQAQSIESQKGATKAIDRIDETIKVVSGNRAAIGTYINRLDYTVNNIASMEYNTQDAEGRIRDTDFSTETTNFTKNQIMVQSATSMLAQANSLPQSVLGLLG